MVLDGTAAEMLGSEVERPAVDVCEELIPSELETIEVSPWEDDIGAVV